MVRIAEIEPGSIAEELNLKISSLVVRINGARVRDGIDLTFLLADTALELETVTPGGETVVYEIEREPGASVGIVPAPNTILECANECVSCFIDSMPLAELSARIGPAELRTGYEITEALRAS